MTPEEIRAEVLHAAQPLVDHILRLQRSEDALAVLLERLVKVCQDDQGRYLNPEARVAAAYLRERRGRS